MGIIKKTTTQKQEKMKEDTGNGTLVFEAKVDNLTSKKFWSLMWAENEFWKNTVTDLNMSDEVVKNVDEKNRILTAKLKMLNFPKPCDQTTEVVIVEQTSSYIKVRTNTKAKGFPFTESFEINQVFEITDLENGKGHIKIYGDVQWIESIMFVVKTAIQSSVAKSIKDAAQIYVKGLTNYESEVTF